VLGRHDDVREMVLRLTLELVDAEKGLLLSDHEGSDNKREVVAHIGFQHDPTDSAIAQRFAEEVIARDETVRQDDETRIDADKRTPADDEVRNLIAIPVYLADDFAGVIVCANREGGFDELNDEVLLAVGDHAGTVLQNSRLHGDLRSAYLSTIRVLADAIELKDPELRGHSDSVSEYVLAVADRMNLDASEREELIFASLLHDVGKLGISERILLKPASLTAEERSVIQLHPRIGFELVSQVPALRHIAPAVLHHHERFDGDGYPARLRGETIPLAARIISVADSFSAIISDRPYSPAQTTEEACRELERCAGDQFDPEVVRLFVEEVRRRPPGGQTVDAAIAESELNTYRHDGEFKLGSPSFGITDSLTLLYSHRHFHESAAAEAQRAELQNRPFGVLVVRLDGMDELNRTRGYSEGDMALRAAASVVQRAAERLGGQAFRVSGRRLGLLAAGAGEVQLGQVAHWLREELDRALAETGLTAPVGTGVWAPGQTGEDVIAGARIDGGAVVTVDGLVAQTNGAGVGETRPDQSTV
jgi:diguanylate cyclase (GGDEF)-like protein